MSHQYAFWRQPNGLPYKSKDGKNAKAHLLSDLAQSAEFGSDDKFKIDLVTYRRNLAALSSAVVILSPAEKELNEDDVYANVEAAVRICIEKSKDTKKITHTDFINELNNRAAEHYRKPSVEYLFRTSITTKSFPVKIFGLGSSKLVLTGRIPKTSDPKCLQDFMIRQPNSAYSRRDSLQPIACFCAARSWNEAAATSLETINHFRGLMALLICSSITARYTSSVDDDYINPIRLGPTHTLHSPVGDSVGDIFWYQRSFRSDFKIYEPNKNWLRICKVFQSLSRIIRKHAFSDAVSVILQRYAAALDDPDHENAFLKLWSILEKITNTVGSKYEETVQRSVRHFHENDLASDLLQYLRIKRNLLVHGAKSSASPIDDVYIIKNVVEENIKHMIFNHLKARTIAEYGDQLAISYSAEDLRRDIAIKKKILNAVLKSERLLKPR